MSPFKYSPFYSVPFFMRCGLCLHYILLVFNVIDHQAEIIFSMGVVVSKK